MHVCSRSVRGLKHDIETDSQRFIASERSGKTHISQSGVFEGSINPTGYLGPIHWSAVMEMFVEHLAAVFCADSRG